MTANNRLYPAHRNVSESVLSHLHPTSGDIASQVHAERARVVADGSKMAASHAVQTVRVNLLGGFEVLLNGHPYDHPHLHRQKVKALLALLVLSEGREQNIEFLERTIWPYSCAEKNRNNFNNLWSLLTRALTLEGTGRCPYLTRHQGVCKINRDLVVSDIAELRLICEQLQFGDVAPAEASILYQRLRQTYRGPVLPGERDNEEILRYRSVWRNRTVDALHLMAASLFEQEWIRESIWFAQTARLIDPSREDVLRLEMKIHLAQGNPSRALAAYSNTRQVLNKNYGLEPSAETRALVERALTNAHGRSQTRAEGRVPYRPEPSRPVRNEATFNPQRKNPGKRKPAAAQRKREANASPAERLGDGFRESVSTQRHDG